MMIKKIISGLLLSVFLSFTLLSFSSCHLFKKSWGEKIEEMSPYPKVGSFVKSFRKQYNVDVEDLTVYSAEELNIRTGGARFRAALPTNESVYNLRSYHRFFAIETIKLIDEDTICLMYKVELKDGEQTIAYVVLQRQIKQRGDHNQGKEYEQWWATGEVYFVSEKLSINDFAQLKVGDSMQNAIDIDPSIKFDALYFGFDSTFTYQVYFAYQILEEGLLIIRFETRDTTNIYENATISSMAYYPYDEGLTPDDVSLTSEQLSALINN